MPPLGSTRILELSISLNGRFDSRQPAANITFYDNDLVKISWMTPGARDCCVSCISCIRYNHDLVTISSRSRHDLAAGAGPVLGGTTITVRGNGFSDYGGANCVLTSRLGTPPLLAPATVQNESVLTCEPTAADGATAGSARMSLGVVLNGQLATEVTGVTGGTGR